MMKKSYEAIGKIYNCTGTTIKKVLKKLGFKLKLKRKINPKETFNKGIKRTKKICKNCDSQTDTFKSRNKNGERSYYRYHRSAPLETKDVENPLNDEPLTDNADGDDVPSSN